MVMKWMIAAAPTRPWNTAWNPILHRLKVGVIGAGGVGMPIISHLARLGVGELVVVDPDVVEPSNLPRLPEATRRDARTWLTAPTQVRILREFGERLRTPKVRLAQRVIRRARREIAVTAIQADVTTPRAALALSDCDWLFPAADTSAKVRLGCRRGVGNRVEV